MTYNHGNDATYSKLIELSSRFHICCASSPIHATATFNVSPRSFSFTRQRDDESRTFTPSPTIRRGPGPHPDHNPDLKS